MDLQENQEYQHSDPNSSFEIIESSDDELNVHKGKNIIYIQFNFGNVRNYQIYQLFSFSLGFTDEIMATNQAVFKATMEENEAEKGNNISAPTPLPTTAILPEMITLDVELIKDSESFGLTVDHFSVENGKMTGLLIKEVIEEGPAHKSGEIMVNDQIVEIDGKSILGYPYFQAVEMLRSTSCNEIVKLKLNRYVSGSKFEQLQERNAYWQSSNWLQKQDQNNDLQMIDTVSDQADTIQDSELDLKRHMKILHEHFEGEHFQEVLENSAKNKENDEGTKANFDGNVIKNSRFKVEPIDEIPKVQLENPSNPGANEILPKIKSKAQASKTNEINHDAPLALLAFSLIFLSGLAIGYVANQIVNHERMFHIEKQDQNMMRAIKGLSATANMLIIQEEARKNLDLSNTIDELKSYTASANKVIETQNKQIEELTQIEKMYEGKLDAAFEIVNEIAESSKIIKKQDAQIKEYINEIMAQHDQAKEELAYWKNAYETVQNDKEIGEIPIESLGYFLLLNIVMGFIFYFANIILNPDFDEDVIQDTLQYRAYDQMIKKELKLSKEVNDLQAAEIKRLDCLTDKYQDALEELIEKYNVCPDLGSLLQVSVLKKLPKMTELLVFKGTDLDATDENGFTALQYAVLYGHFEAGNLLIENGAQIDLGNDESLLHFASYRGHAKIAKDLILYGANLDSRDKNQNTALHNVAEFGHLEMAKVLVEYGADKKAMNSLNKTPLDVAKRSKNIDMIKLLH